MTHRTVVGGVVPAELHNFRDLGGLPAGDGRTTRCGLVFRSESLHLLTDEGRRALVEDIGVRTVVDLRATVEQRGAAPQWMVDSRLDYVSLPFTDGFDEIEPFLDERGLRELVGRKYLRYLVEARSNIIAAIEQIAGAAYASSPVVFHCTYGKDRTGVLAALLLELAGVDRRAIVEDYQASQLAMPELLDRMANDPVHGPRINLVPREIYRADEHSIHLFLQNLDTEGGSVAWAVKSGLSRTTIDDLREALLR